MKTFLILLGLVAAGIVGYSFEPDLRYSLTGKVPESRKAKPPVIAADNDDADPGIDLSGLDPDKLPRQVVLKSNVEITDPAVDLNVTIAAGTSVYLLRIEGRKAVISPGSDNYQAAIPISQTDLMEQLAVLNPVEEETVVTPPPAAETAASPDPFPEPEPADEPADEPEVPTEAEPAADPFAEAEPEPQPEPPPAAAAAESENEVVALMQSSIKEGGIKAFTFDQVLAWKASPAPETIDGETYQTGLASYKAETLFGVKTIQAKALIKDGKVVKWLWPKSGLEIK